MLDSAATNSEPASSRPGLFTLSTNGPQTSLATPPKNSKDDERMPELAWVRMPLPVRAGMRIARFLRQRYTIVYDVYSRLKVQSMPLEMEEAMVWSGQARRRGATNAGVVLATALREVFLSWFQPVGQFVMKK
jgi:hypothetical protein